MKTLPLPLQRTIAQAHQAVVQDPQHRLGPFYRQQIYRAMGAPTDPAIVCGRRWLALLAAEYVFPRWQEIDAQRNFSDLQHQLAHALRSIEGLLRGSIPRELGVAEYKELGTAYHSAFPEFQPDAWELYNLICILDTILWALGESLYDFVIDDALLTEDATDELDLDPYSGDTAKYAALSWAGSTRDPAADPRRRRKFWEWWLHDALPAAWQAAR